MSDETVTVDWRNGRRAEVSRELHEWIVEKIPEATTPDARADLYEIGSRLSRMLSAVGNAKLATAQMLVARNNAASQEVVDAWDALQTAMAGHPNYRADHMEACAREEVDLDEAVKYTAALRSVIDIYRVPTRLPKGGRAPLLKNQWMAESAEHIRRILGVDERRAAEIVSGIVRLAGGRSNAQSLRQKMRTRRVNKG